MINFVKYRLIKFLEKIPFIQILIYNNLIYFKFLLPHDKDYFALKLIFNKNEKKSFVDVGGNIGISTLGFRQLGFHKNDILVFEPDDYLYSKFLIKIRGKQKKIKIFNFGLSNKNQTSNLFRAFYKNIFVHFNNSFDLNYLKKKIKANYPENYKNFKYKKKKFVLKRFDDLNIQKNISFIKIDVEGFDHLVIKGMRKLIMNQKPVFLIEFNKSNFKIIYNLLKKKYNCYIYMLEKNYLKKILLKDLNKIKNFQTPDAKYSKNSFNVYFIPKDYIF